VHGGLINQLYTHLPAIGLAIMLRANLLLASALRRSSYAHASALDTHNSRLRYIQTPLNTLFDVEHLQLYMAGEWWCANHITLPLQFTVSSKCSMQQLTFLFTYACPSCLVILVF
jgi:hypothetical protein